MDTKVFHPRYARFPVGLKDPEGPEEAEDGTIGLGPEDGEDLGSSYHSVPDGYLAARCNHRSYCIMGRPSPYMVVAGHSSAVGMESINGGNVGYYDSMMNALRECQLCHHYQPKGFSHAEPLPHPLSASEWLWKISKVEDGTQGVP